MKNMAMHIFSGLLKFAILIGLTVITILVLVWSSYGPMSVIVEYKKYLLTGNYDQGRLGNKMFKYASLLGIARREGRQFFVSKYTQDFDMEKLFTLSHVDHQGLYNSKGWPVIKEVSYARDDPVFWNLTQQNLYIEGYLQSFKYFQSIENVIRQEYTLTDTMKAKVRRVFQDIRSKYPRKTNITFVGVHVRRKDEKSVLNTTEAPKSFFVNAFRHMRSLIPKQRLVFVVASNQLQWCHENLLGLNDTVVLPPDSPEVHFAVLASCKHFVVSVGSYGWWAGWLTGGQVIYYKQFPWKGSFEYIGFFNEDYYPPSWIPIDH